MNKIKFILIPLIALAFVSFINPALAQTGQGYPTTTVALVTSTNSVAANTTATVTSQAFTANTSTGFAVVPNIVVSGSTATLASATFNFQASPDGVNWTSTAPLSYTLTASGTVPAIGYQNFPVQSGSNAAANIGYWRLGSVTTGTGTGSLTINSITISKSNR
jgi:hypothetical protein